MNQKKGVEAGAVPVEGVVAGCDGSPRRRPGLSLEAGGIEVEKLTCYWLPARPREIASNYVSGLILLLDNTIGIGNIISIRAD